VTERIVISDPPLPDARRRVSARELVRRYGGLSMLLFLLALNAAVTPNFVGTGTLRNFLMQIHPTLLVALGMTLVIATGGIDISVGAVMALSASVTGRVYTAGSGLAPALLAGLATGCACGLFNGFLVAKFRIQAIIVTLILMIGGRGLAQIVLGELFLSVYGTGISKLGTFTFFGFLPIQVLIMAVVSGLSLFAVERTIFGRHIQAIGDNPKAARLVGIRIPFYLMLVYVASGLLSGIAGILEGARINAINAGTLGLLVELDAIAAVAIGGTAFQGGKPLIGGTLVGASIAQLITMMVNMNDIPFHYSLIVKAAIVVAALYLQRDRLS
jgi:ribose/xylose/arabinose/galactoside ABC-type transport system permease subunit